MADFQVNLCYSRLLLSFLPLFVLEKNRTMTVVVLDTLIGYFHRPPVT